MRIDVIETYERFESLRSNWDSVYSADPEAQFFLSWIWMSQLFTRRSENWCVLAAMPSGDSSEYAAFFPLRLKTRFSKSRKATINEIYMGGNFWADYTGLICYPKYDEIAIPALAGHLKKMCWAKLHLENIRTSNRRIELFTDQFASTRFRKSNRNRTSKVDGINNLICPSVSLPTEFENYLESRLSANTRQKIRRGMRSIDAADDLTIVESNSETRERDLDALARFWRLRWAKRKGRKVDTLARKYRRIIEQGLEGDIVHMPLLLQDDRPVAAHASFIDREKKCLLFFVAGRDLSWTGLPSGLMLHAHSIRWAIEHGMHTYDLLRGNEQYKYSLGAKDKLIACIRVETLTGTNLNDQPDP